MKVLVTGADGFVGSLLVRRLAELGHETVAAVRPSDAMPRELARRDALGDVPMIELEVLDSDSVRRAVDRNWDVIVHMAAVSSGSQAQRDPMSAWHVNAVGTARIAYGLGAAKAAGGDPLLLFVSTAEVYGAGSEASRVETDVAQPVSPYAASKLAAEVACLETSRRTGLRVVIARPFPHIGPGQDERFVVPAFLERIRFAKKIDAPVVKVGRIAPVREFTHVVDVVSAYALLIDKGRAGEVYNVSCGRATSVRDIFFMISDALGHRVIPEEDHELIRPVDIPYLVGDSSKLRVETGWKPTISLEETIREIVDAEAN
ncbi:MAG: GDP-mannose 4,6-dehydratase [Gemmatimonadota bacterium]|nr:MAG: GDP-mannose 4,6-dehydratase [Gemmatimonadota bacterium]